MKKIDTLLAGQPDLRKKMIALAGHPGVSGDMILKALREAGIDARRSAVFNWMADYRTAERHRPNSLAGRVAAAVLKLGRQRLIELAEELNVPRETEKRNNCRSA